MPPILTHLPRWRPRTAGGRLALLSVGVLVVVQVAAYVGATTVLSAHRLDAQAERLSSGQRLLDRLLEQRAQALLERTQRLAQDDSLKAAARVGDAPAIAGHLRDGRRDGDAGELTWLAPALAGPEPATAAGARPDRIAAAAGLALRGAAGGPTRGLVLLDGRPHLMALAPVHAPAPAGWVLGIEPLDDRLGRELQQLAGLELTLLVREASQAPWQPLASTLAPAQAAALAARGVPAEGLADSADEHAVRTRWLTTSDTTGAGTGPSTLAVVSLPADTVPGTRRELALLLAAVTLVGGASLATLAVRSARRVAAAHAAAVHQLAWHDAPTGLPNRARLRHLLDEAAAQGPGPDTGTTLLAIGLDRFDRLEERLGRPSAERLIRAIAERLTQQALRGHGLVSRLSDHAFAVLLRQGDPVLARAVAQRLAQTFEQPFVLDEHRLDVRVSIGIARHPGDTTSADELLRRAETALWAARRRGDGPLAYDAALDPGGEPTRALVDDLRRALGRGELRLFLQPRLSLADGRVAGAEVTTFWQHPRRGLLPPEQFVPIAERAGLLLPLTAWTFEEAARLWLECQSHGTLPRLSLNLSAQDLVDAELPARLDALLVSHRVPAEAFCLEMSERALVDDLPRARATLNRLAAMGFRLSVDGFGTGHASLASLKRLPVDELKIDPSLVLGVERDLDDASIVRAAIDLAHHLGLTVVAEGVENARACELLRELRCDEAQGSHIGRAMPAEQFGKWTSPLVERRRPFAASSPMRLH